MLSVFTQLDQIMSYAVFLAKKVRLHLSGTTGAKVVPQRRPYFIFRDLTPSSSEALFLSSVLQFSVVCEAIINHISPVFSVRGLGRWLLCGLWGILEGGKALWTKNVWRCLVWGGTLMHPAQTHMQKLERRNQVDGHAGPVG